MLKKTKPLSIKKAKENSRNGHIKRTNAVKNSCISTINRFIESAGEAGETYTGNWFKNTSGFLTPTVIAEIVELFKAEGYNITAEQTEDSKEYYIRIDWDTAC